MNITINRINKRHGKILFILLANFLSSFYIFGSSDIYGFELYSKNDMPFGVPYDVWIG
jgi:hypothetical protein